MPWHAPAKIKRGGHFCVLTGMWGFQTITYTGKPTPQGHATKLGLRSTSSNAIISLLRNFLIFPVFGRHPELSDHCSDWITRVQETKTKYDSAVQYGFVFCACGITKSNIFWIFMTLSRMIPRVVLWIWFQKNLLQRKRFFLPFLFSTVNTSGQYSPDRTKNISVRSPFYSKHRT